MSSRAGHTRAALIGAAAVAMLVLSAAGGNATGVKSDLDAPEGCEAVNPVAPTCKFTVMEDMEGPVAGATGYGTWMVKIKRGKQKLSIQSPSGYGEPSAQEFLFEKGDKVTVTAVSPGSGVIAGGD
jgi:hypothetical protein